MMQHRKVVEGHEESLLPAGKNWKLVWNDEFDGRELDTTKWNFRLNFWGRRFPAFTDEGLELDGQSHMKIHLVKRPDGSYCSAQLQTGGIVYDIPKEYPQSFWPFGAYEQMKFLHKFGYYEIRCRLNKQSGWWVAFWLQSPSIGAHPDPRRAGVECDIMESQEYAQDKTIRCGNIWNGYGVNCAGSGHKHPLLEDTPDGWHHFGVDWSKDGYVFYADGKEVNRVDGPVSETEQFVLVTTEPMGYRAAVDPKADPALDKVVFPEYFEVDYVRVFDEI